MSIGFLTIDWTDILDIILVATLLYNVYYLVRGSIASKIFAGYMILYVFYLFIRLLGLELMTAILQYFMGVGAVALIVIFQQEIRRFLIILGRSTIVDRLGFFGRFLGAPVATIEIDILKNVVDASKMIASEFNGAIIVIAKRDDLLKYVETGVTLNADVSKPLLISLFSQYSSLNEGAVIVVEEKIVAARCVLPVAEEIENYEQYGFRHRAALGMSDATDAAVIVISEQTGRISLAINSKLYRNLNAKELENKLNNYLNSTDSITSKEKKEKAKSTD